MASLLRQLGAALFAVIFYILLLFAVIALSIIGALGYIWFKGEPLSDHDLVILRDAAGSLLLFLPVAYLAWRRRCMLNQTPTGSQHANLRRRLREQEIQRLSLAVWAVLLGGYFFLHSSYLGAMKLVTAGGGLLFLWGGFHLYLLSHEAGHALAGWAAGLQLYTFHCGSGPNLFKWISPRGALVIWRLWPTWGFVRGFSRGEKASRWRRFILLAGGPSVSILLVTGFYFALMHAARHGHRHVDHQLFSMAGWPLLVGCAFATLMTLLPLRNNHPEAPGSDGAQMLALLRAQAVPPLDYAWAYINMKLMFFWSSGQMRLAKAELEEITARWPELATRLQFYHGFFQMFDGDYAAGRACVEEALSDDGWPADLRTLIQGYLVYAYVGEGRDEDARKLIAETLGKIPPAAKPSLLDLYAWLPVITGRHEYLAEAKGWMEEAMKLAPRLRRLHSTQAALLMEAGDIADGVPAVRGILHGTYTDGDRGIAAFYYARHLRAEKKSPAEVERWRKRALDWCPQPWLVRRIEQELGGAGLS